MFPRKFPKSFVKHGRFFGKQWRFFFEKRLRIKKPIKVFEKLLFIRNATVCFGEQRCFDWKLPLSENLFLFAMTKMDVLVAGVLVSKRVPAELSRGPFAPRPVCAD